MPRLQNESMAGIRAMTKAMEANQAAWLAGYRAGVRAAHTRRAPARVAALEAVVRGLVTVRHGEPAVDCLIRHREHAAAALKGDA